MGAMIRLTIQFNFRLNINFDTSLMGVSEVLGVGEIRKSVVPSKLT